MTIEASKALPNMKQRFRGALLGLAAGDALGATNEFKRPGSFKPVTEIVGGGPFQLEAGQWTDDTSCALCLAESLVVMGKLDGGDCMRRLLKWRQEGYLSSNGRCFDIGPSTGRALSRFKQDGNPWQASPEGDSNGCLMRLAPVPLAFSRTFAGAVDQSGLSARLTHGHRDAVAATCCLGGLIQGILSGADKADLLPRNSLYAPLASVSLTPAVRKLASGAYRSGTPRAGFDALGCLRCALWAFDRSTDFRSAVTLAANLGEDSDTVAAVAGQLAGAYYGEASIPEGWRALLTLRGRIEELADGLLSLSELS